MDFALNMDDVTAPAYQDASPYVADGKDWEKSLHALARAHCPNGPTGYRLEINSHGLPAEILLKPLVTFSNLPTFSALVRRLLRAGSSIEILACLVARFSGTGLAKGAGKGTGFENLMRRSDKDLLHQERLLSRQGEGFGNEFGEYDLRSQTSITPEQIVYLATAAIQSGQERLGSEKNGALFCARLAKDTSCTVRAAMIPQGEEKEKTGDKYYRTAFGKWDGHVLDFQPSGSVRYAGFDLPRPVFKIYEQFGRAV